MKLIEVTDKKHEKDFLRVAVQLYKKSDHWIRPLDKDIRSVFDINKNPIAKPGSYTRFLLKDEHGKLLGRIAAFINSKTAYKEEQYPVGGIGFYECIDDQHAANILFNAAKKWLTEKGMETMEGPINFGDRDKFWGLLTSGYNKEPNYLANYNFSYYKSHFKNFGFKEYFNQFTFTYTNDSEFNPEYSNKARSVVENPEFKFRHISKSQLDLFTEDFRIIYNKAWAKHLGVSDMTSRKAKAIIKSIKPVLDEKTAWFGYFKDEPIAFFIMIPEVNQIFKHINGKLDTRGKLIFLYHKLRQNNTKLLGLIFGVIPEFDGKGVTNAITYVAKRELTGYKKYKSLEMHGIGDFNPGMIKFVHKIGDIKKTKIHTTFRYQFDRSRPFERMPLKENNRNNP